MSKQTNKPETKCRRHPLAIRLEDFVSANPDLGNAVTLGTKAPNYYLWNRIERAFKAGWKACEDERKAKR